MKRMLACVGTAPCMVSFVFGTLVFQSTAAFAQNWCAPVNLGPVVNTSFQEGYPQVAPNGLALYFESNRPGGFGGFDLYVSQRATPADPWGPPQNLGPIINSSGDERTPHWTPDGTSMYFSSTQAGGFGKLDFYVTSREDPNDDFGWGPLENIGEPINTALDDVGGEFDLNAGWQIKWFYFTRESLVPPAGPPAQFNYDIMVSKVQAHGHTERFKEPEFASFNDPVYRDTQPAIRADGLELIFSSNRSPSPNFIPDIFAVTRASLHDDWRAPVHLGTAINSPVRDENGSYDVGDTTGNTLLLMSARPGGQGGLDLYSSTRTCRAAAAGIDGLLKAVQRTKAEQLGIADDELSAAASFVEQASENFGAGQIAGTLVMLESAIGKIKDAVQKGILFTAVADFIPLVVGDMRDEVQAFIDTGTAPASAKKDARVVLGEADYLTSQAEAWAGASPIDGIVALDFWKGATDKLKSAYEKVQ